MKFKLCENHIKLIGTPLKETTVTSDIFFCFPKNKKLGNHRQRLFKKKIEKIKKR